jgi:hypothetical protein
VVIQLALVLAFTIHLRHSFQRIEHGLHDPVEGAVDADTDFEALSSYQLILDTSHVDGEVFDEVRDALPFLAGQLGLLYVIDLLRLP